MKSEVYLQIQMQLMNLVAIVRDMPLEEFIASADRAESVGPIFDPTLYQQVQHNLGQIKRLAKALLEFKKVVMEITNGDC